MWVTVSADSYSWFMGMKILLTDYWEGTDKEIRRWTPEVYLGEFLFLKLYQDYQFFEKYHMN